MKDMKADPKNLPQLMSGKKAIVNIKHLTKENQKMKLLVFYEIHFSVIAISGGAPGTRNRSRKPNRNLASL